MANILLEMGKASKLSTSLAPHTNLNSPVDSMKQKFKFNSDKKTGCGKL